MDKRGGKLSVQETWPQERSKLMKLWRELRDRAKQFLGPAFAYQTTKTVVPRHRNSPKILIRQ